MEVPVDLVGQVDEWSSRDATDLYLARHDSIIGAIALEDEIRPKAREAIDELTPWAWSGW